ncbi:hypothetical protein QUB42_28285, partial [Microcoleus sp. Aus8_D1]|uniref:hypothetical protein n=1 Tax=Microcoleus sp. Aus8_D1 TaxID=3055302 RepID=UPI002FCE7B00
FYNNYLSSVSQIAYYIMSGRLPSQKRLVVRPKVRSQSRLSGALPTNLIVVNPLDMILYIIST